MKQVTILSLALITLLSTTACNQNSAPNPESANNNATGSMAETGTTAGTGFAGTVTETMDSGGYTYVHVDTGSEKIWAAAPEFAVKVGDPIKLPPGMPMNNFHSDTLNRDFEVVHFVSGAVVGTDIMEHIPEAKIPSGHPVIATTNSFAPEDLASIAKAEDGQLILEIFERKDELKGQPVKVRGKVVKYSPNIMGKNWLHIQDASLTPGSGDLTVTTSNTAKVGDTVLVTGTLTTDINLGFNYRYEVLIESAEVVVE